MRFIILVALLFGGGLSAQWGDCFTYDINRTYASISDPYDDSNGDGCRDDNYKWVVHFNSMLMRGAPVIPNGAYHRVKVEIIGNNTFDYISGQVLETWELNPDGFYNNQGNNVGVQGYYARVNLRMENQPVQFKYAFMRVSILTYIWHNFGPPGAGEYVGFPGSYCDSRIRTFCNGASGNPGNPGPGYVPKPDLVKGTNGNLQTSEGTTFIDGVGSVPKLRSGASFSYNVDCKNEGDALASNFWVQTYVNTSTSFSPPTNGTPGPYVGSDQYVGSLAPNASINHTQTDWVNQHGSKFNTSGWRYFHTYFDHQRTVTESAEGNNGFTQRAYYYHAGTPIPDNDEGRIVLNHLNVANEISFLYQTRNPLTNQMESQIGKGLALSIFPALTGPTQLQVPVFQTTINQQDNQIDITSLPLGAYRLVINGHYIKRFLVN